MAPEFSNLIHGFLSPYLQKRKKKAPEKTGLAPELFLVSMMRSVFCIYLSDERSLVQALDVRSSRRISLYFVTRILEEPATSFFRVSLLEMEAVGFSETLPIYQMNTASLPRLRHCYVSFRTINFPCCLPYCFPTLHIIEWYIKADV
jgi:hypothetical protein